MPRTTPPFRADHVGSLLRPKKLLDARQSWKDGRLAREELAALEDAAILEAVAMQEGVGLKSVTDGEFRRDDWYLDFIFSLDGIERGDETFPIPFSDGDPFTATKINVTGKVACPPGGVMRNHYAYLHHVTEETAKITIPAPSMLRNLFVESTDISREAYPDPEEFWVDLGQAYRDVMMELASCGCRYLQLDDVNTCLLCNDELREMNRKAGRDPDALLDMFISVNNAAIAERPEDMVVTTHMCRGNYRSQWCSTGAYDTVAEKYFNGMDIDGFFLEYDSERAGGFEPLRFMPRGKFAVLGLVTSKTPQLESKDDLKRRIDEAARHLPLEQLCLSPQCGFASTHQGNRLSEDDQRRKLTLVVEVADEIWGYS
ncbi:MAG: 5-methyltetrahydropteroyltriglutamate--homocysteine S-methyltransferase [Gammaproteobacteria bacterium]|nr:5-methyltetrahydropteroyltriglutamate--homocysteine S-methyltransferase [Gammaproteobacteria bacterium]